MTTFDAPGTSAHPISRRVLLGGAAAAAMAFALPACSAGSTVGGQSGAGSKKSLSMLMLGPNDKTVSEMNTTILPAFTDETGITVELQTSDWGSGFQKVTTAAASGTLTDVVMMGGIWLAPLASKKAVLPIEDLLKDYADASEFFPGMLKDCEFGGHTYGLPLYSDTRTAMYRKSFLEKAGVDTSTLPTTWSEYADVAAKVSKAGGGPLAFPVDLGADRSVGLQQSYAQLMFQAGGTYYDDSGKAIFASDQGVKALDYMTGFYRRNEASADQVNTGTGPSPFVAGDTAMGFSGFSTIQNARQFAPDVEKDIVLGDPLAVDSSGKPTTSAWINKLGISAKTKNRDGAWQLLQFLNNQDNSAKLAELYGGLPARKDLADAPYLKDISPNLVKAAQYIVPQPPSPNMLAIAPQINTSMQEAIRLGKSSKDILAALDAKINEINGV